VISWRVQLKQGDDFSVGRTNKGEERSLLVAINGDPDGYQTDFVLDVSTEGNKVLTKNPDGVDAIHATGTVSFATGGAIGTIPEGNGIVARGLNGVAGYAHAAPRDKNIERDVHAGVLAVGGSGSPGVLGRGVNGVIGYENGAARDLTWEGKDISGVIGNGGRAGTGVRGIGGNGGVMGESTNSTGVAGTSTLSPGVSGSSSSGVGVSGTSDTGPGVFRRVVQRQWWGLHVEERGTNLPDPERYRSAQLPVLYYAAGHQRCGPRAQVPEKRPRRPVDGGQGQPGRMHPLVLREGRPARTLGPGARW
jgi:hypothetical protein